MNATTARPWRVILVEPQPIVGKALRHLLSTDRQLEVLADAHTLADANLATQMPDLLVLDIDGLEGSLDETITSIRTSSPSTRILILTSHIGPQLMQHSLTCRVDGYVVKDITPGEFMRACEAVARGESYFDPRVAGGLLRRLTAQKPPQDELSLRESEIVRLIGSGLSNKEIGDRLCLSEKTVKNYVSRIFSKLQINARTQAAVYAIRNGIV
jgi:two-component system response regulator DevR